MGPFSLLQGSPGAPALFSRPVRPAFPARDRTRARPCPVTRAGGGAGAAPEAARPSPPAAGGSQRAPRRLRPPPPHREASERRARLRRAPAGAGGGRRERLRVGPGGGGRAGAGRWRAWLGAVCVRCEGTGSASLFSRGLRGSAELYPQVRSSPRRVWERCGGEGGRVLLSKAGRAQCNAGLLLNWSGGEQLPPSCRK